jgi:FecR protein
MSLENWAMFRTYFVISGIFLVGLTSAPSAFAAKMGEVVAVVGAPSASGPAGNRTLSAGSEVFEDDSVHVSTGNAQILLDDGTRLVVGPDSTLLLDQFVMRSGASKAEKVSISALRGTYRFITGRSAKSAYKIRTLQATIGIRGTGFDYWVIKKTGAVVLSGAVVLAGIKGGSVKINSGCEMGEATFTTARPLLGKEKNKTIRENLPFLQDQSLLTPRFRLNVTACRLGPPDEEDGDTDGTTAPQENLGGGTNGRVIGGGNDGPTPPDTTNGGKD